MSESTLVDPRCSAACGERIGLIAAWGRYPTLVAEQLRAAGHQVFALGVREHCDPELANRCDAFDWVGVARLGQAIRFFRRHRVRHATMAGKIHKVRLFEPRVFWNHLPDWTGFKTYYRQFLLRREDRRDDTILGAIVQTFAQAGITMHPATDFAPGLLIQSGCLTERTPSAAQWADVRFGWELAKEMGRLDVGQTVAVQHRAAIAIEAIEGTDLCIRRAGELCKGGFTLVKVAKPQQDMRFDVPTVGIQTIESMIAAGAQVLAVEAGKTILVDQAAVVALANQHRLAIVAIDAPPASL